MKTAICLSPSSLPAVHIYCYFFPKGRINPCGKSPKLLELGKVPFYKDWAWQKPCHLGKSLKGSGSHHTLMATARACEGLAEICSSCSRLKLPQKRGQERVCHSLGFCCMTFSLAHWIWNKRADSFLLNKTAGAQFRKKNPTSMRKKMLLCHLDSVGNVSSSPMSIPKRHKHLIKDPRTSAVYL